MTKPEFIKLLGKRSVGNKGEMRMYALYKCPVCLGNWEVEPRYVNSGRINKCRTCGLKITAEKNRTHGESNTKLFRVWTSMKSMTENYKMDELWKSSYVEFKKWALANKYKVGKTLKRINIKQGYFPNNCIFITKPRHGLSRDKLYGVYRMMIKRCYDETNEKYKSYGHRGISVCKDWRNDFLTFRHWAINNGYSNGLSIERVDNDGKYCPENCTFIPMIDQIYNQRVRCNNRTGYRGVKNYNGAIDKFVASIDHCKKRIRIGVFKTALDASIARNKYIIDNNLPHKLNDDYPE